MNPKENVLQIEASARDSARVDRRIGTILAGEGKLDS